jgi:hypothetical protein
MDTFCNARTTGNKILRKQTKSFCSTKMVARQYIRRVSRYRAGFNALFAQVEVFPLPLPCSAY